MAIQKMNAAILLFPDVEVLDFAGPFEVFSRTRLVPGVESRRSNDSAPFYVFTVAKSQSGLAATGGLQITPDFAFDHHPRIDLLVVPGGFGTRPLLADEETLDWIRRTAKDASLVTSVCTGALLLSKTDLLNDISATTHWSALELLESIAPKTRVLRDIRFVDSGKVITSAGVSAGIDMALHIVERLHGKAIADETARYIEYDR